MLFLHCSPYKTCIDGSQLYLDSFLLIAFLVAAGKTIFAGDFQVWSDIMSSSFSSASTAFEISLGLTGVLALWMGLMKIGERGGVITFFGR